MRRAGILLLGIFILFLGLGHDSSCAEQGKAGGKFIRTGKTVYRHEGGTNGVVLKNGDVLIYSFDAADRDNVVGMEYRIQAEIYRTKIGKFEAIPNPNYFHFGNTEPVLLNDGRVLLSGASCLSTEHPTVEDEERCENSKHIEIYDPQRNKFIVGPKMLIPRYCSGTTLLKDGRVLFTGGLSASPEGATNNRSITAQSEIYDPEKNMFKLSGSFTAGRTHYYGSAVTLNDGKVLAIADLNAIELFDPVSETFRRARNIKNKIGDKDYCHLFSTKLLSGKVMISVSAMENSETHQRSLYIYNPESEDFEHLSPSFNFEGKSLQELKDGSIEPTEKVQKA